MRNETLSGRSDCPAPQQVLGGSEKKGMKVFVFFLTSSFCFVIQCFLWRDCLRRVPQNYFGLQRVEGLLFTSWP